jgi:hypothetical protein
MDNVLYYGDKIGILKTNLLLIESLLTDGLRRPREHRPTRNVKIPLKIPNANCPLEDHL